VLWRELADGAIEVAARRKDHLERLRVNDDGSISHVAMVALPSKRLQRRKLLEFHLGGQHEWHEPTDLHGWAPRTSAQLAAVEQIADDHDGRALVRDVGAATIDVCAPRKGALDWYVIDGEGRVEQRPNSSRRQQRWLRRLMVLASVVLWFGAPAIAQEVGKIARWIGVAVGFALGIAALVLLWRHTPEERLKRRDPSWIVIRTYIDDD
jgi:hypothetical protein